MNTSTKPDLELPLAAQEPQAEQSVAVRAPSGWALERAMSIAQQALAAAGDPGITDTDDLLAIVMGAGVDVHGLLLRLCLSAKEDEANAEACKKREVEVADRRKRFERNEETKRAAVFGIIQALPDLFPERKFQHALVLAGLRDGKDGIVVTDIDKLPVRFVETEKKAKMAELKTAILKDGEIIEGAEKRNGSPSLFIKTT